MTVVSAQERRKALDRVRASQPAQTTASLDQRRVDAYIGAIDALIAAAADRGEDNIVAKLAVEEYSSEQECGLYVASIAKQMRGHGYTCSVSYDTFGLNMNEYQVSHTIMRNPKIIALTLAW